MDSVGALERSLGLLVDVDNSSYENIKLSNLLGFHLTIGAGHFHKDFELLGLGDLDHLGDFLATVFPVVDAELSEVDIATELLELGDRADSLHEAHDVPIMDWL